MVTFRMFRAIKVWPTIFNFWHSGTLALRTAQDWHFWPAYVISSGSWAQNTKNQNNLTHQNQNTVNLMTFSQEMDWVWHNKMTVIVAGTEQKLLSCSQISRQLPEY